MQSSNGIFVNKLKIQPAVPYVLNDGDEVALGVIIGRIKEQYRSFEVGKNTSFETITLDTSDDDDIL